MIQLASVTKSYPIGGGITVLRDVTFAVAAGEFVGIIGPSGSGKSSLLHILGLLDRPTTGTFHFDGIDVATLSDAHLSALRGSRLGFVFQSFHLVAHLSVLENVELPLFYQRVPRNHRHRRAAELLDQVGLSHRLHHHPGQLSGGECQRTAIARALVSRPTLILADEPTGNLDSRTGADILALFDAVHRQGTSIIMITHDPRIAGRIPRVLHINDGILTEAPR
jgi:putative ABC transport system ATP-binding protein